MSLIIKNINKTFTNFPALRDVTFEAKSGEFIALLGPSGSGKTTLLRLLAGLDTPNTGEISFEGENYLKLNPRDRRVGMVFQSYALFRHMTVAQNIAFGLNVRPAKERPSKSEIKATVERLLKLIQLEDLGKRYPSQLSGGQRQRVALARALAINPRLLLLDEPFGALDALVRKDLRRWLKRIHHETGVTTIFVTHDQEEALDLADRVVVLKAGKVEQIGTPLDIHSNPKSAFVFDFLGSANKAQGSVKSGVAQFDGFSAPVIGAANDGDYVLRFRPYEAQLSRGGPGLPVTVTAVLPAGSTLRLELTGADGALFETQHPHGSEAQGFEVGDTLRLKPERVYAYA
ncbi:sulfate/molybdate ABC transporter ATP-binding protein [Asticcacaulis sp. 201]|uniref:sulfate/molybdate ABC transporter ATP-binding protein n=1 Tax=Asticcacaulis sp. 201 TaxID=3028787 RepID=UPI002915D584|nr:sulfate/molybdate ABC transporter ATP-binding protein [Asticcacaulis sp. 201]MDV6332827.1 sulfate/molybdate ABC transporter ATP-binding protein [Asticcacaulis sp. 201]